MGTEGKAKWPHSHFYVDGIEARRSQTPVNGFVVDFFVMCCVCGDGENSSPWEFLQTQFGVAAVLLDEGTLESIGAVRENKC